MSNNVRLITIPVSHYCEKARWGDGRQYLLGDRVSAIDLTFAALAAPLLQPPEHHVPPSPIDVVPPQIQADIRACRATLAGEFGLRLYREHRRHNTPYKPKT